MGDSLVWKGLTKIPTSTLQVLGRWGAALHHRFDPRHVEECERMVKWCRPQWDEKAIIKGMYQSLWQLPADLRQFYHHGEAITPKVIGLEAFLQKLEGLPERPGVVFVTAHLGVWELCSQVICRTFRPMMSIYKPSQSEWINRFFLDSRTQNGQVIVPKEGGITPLFKHLRRGGVVGLVMDQHGGNAGVRSSFLGKACLSWDSAVLLAQRSRSPIMPVTLIRRGPDYEILHGELTQVAPDSSDSDIQSHVQHLDDQLAAMVEEAPDQWMWLGRKWGRDFDR